MAESEPTLVKPFSLRDEYLDSVDIRELLLRPAECKADYAATLTCIASPRDTQELRELANIIRDAAEPHVHTRIPRDGIVRAEREADKFPHVQDKLTVELSHAYYLLALFEDVGSEKRGEFDQECARLEKPIIEKFTRSDKESSAELLNVFTLIIFCIRKASRFYLAAAWYWLMDAHGKFGDEVEKNAKRAIEGYEQTLGILEGLIEIEDQPFMLEIRKMEKEKGRGASLLEFLEYTMRRNSEHTSDAQREFYTHIILGEHRALMQDVLFGMARAHCLLGDHVNAAKMAGWLEGELKSPMPGTEPAPIIIESLRILEEEMRKNPGKPFVPASPKIMHDAMQDTIRSFSRGPNRIWMPGDKRALPMNPMLVDAINNAPRTERTPEFREGASQDVPTSTPILEKIRSGIGQLVKKLKRAA